MLSWLREHRPASLGDTLLLLPGAAPRAGDMLGSATFTLPAARNVNAPMTRDSLMRGLALLSTLPNIAKHACAAQILDLEEEATRRLEEFRLVHVSADDARHWAEVDQFHPDLRAEAFTLVGATKESAAAFTRAFGVAVRGQRRIAHGLFALLDGMFLAAEVPFDQMRVPDVGGFLQRIERLLGVVAPATPRQTSPTLAADAE
jgi:peroxiredoxin